MKLQTSSEQHDAFAHSLRQTLRETENSIDMATQSKLTQARHKALEQQSQGFFSWPQWAGIGGSVCAGIVVAIMFVNPTYDMQQPTSTVISTGISTGNGALAATDMPIALDNNWDLYEDLEFYEWLNEIQRDQT